MALTAQSQVLLPTGRTCLGFFVGDPRDQYTGDLLTGLKGIETLLNARTIGHKIEVFHAIVGNNWESGSYFNSRNIWANYTGQPLISVPSFFPYTDPGTNTRATYDKALNGQYDTFTGSDGKPGGYRPVLSQIAADYPYAAIRLGQEVDGDWFWWGLSGSQGSANGGTTSKAGQLHAHLYDIWRSVGGKGPYIVNCGNYGGINIANVVPTDPNKYDLVDCDDYATANTPAQSTDPVSAWNNVQKPMIMNTINTAKRDGKRWSMCEWGITIRYTTGSGYGTGDNAYYIQQVRNMALDPTLPECAFLNYFNGNDYNTGVTPHTLDREDAIANPTTINSGPWVINPHTPNAGAEMQSANWTVAGLTRTVIQTPAASHVIGAGKRGRFVARS